VESIPLHNLDLPPVDPPAVVVGVHILEPAALAARFAQALLAPAQVEQAMLVLPALVEDQAHLHRDHRSDELL